MSDGGNTGSSQWKSWTEDSEMVKIVERAQKHYLEALNNANDNTCTEDSGEVQKFICEQREKSELYAQQKHSEDDEKVRKFMEDL